MLLGAPRSMLRGGAHHAQRARVKSGVFAHDMTKAKIARYELQEIIGRGGMGTVYEAYDDRLDRKIALKLLHQENDQQTERLIREARAMAKIKHPNVVPVFDTGEHEGHVYIAMEFISGQNLREWQHLAPAAPRPWKECVRVYIEAGRGLAAAHAKGLVHRDFKPSNCVIDDEDGRVRVLDFGLVSATGRAEGIRPSTSDAELEAIDLCRTLTRSGTAVGTPAYMPLEQHRRERVDEKADQFSFCVALYEAIYGERPFAGKTPVALIVSLEEGRVRPPREEIPVPSRLRKILKRGLSREPSARWSSMDMLLSQLERLTRPTWRRTMAVTIGAATVALAFGIWWQAQREKCSNVEHLSRNFWGEAHRIQLIQAIDDPVASAEIVRRLDTYVEQWSRARMATCNETVIRGRQSDETMEERLVCLHEHQKEFEVLVGNLLQGHSLMPEEIQGGQVLRKIRCIKDIKDLPMGRPRIPRVFDRMLDGS